MIACILSEAFFFLHRFNTTRVKVLQEIIRRSFLSTVIAVILAVMSHHRVLCCAEKPSRVAQLLRVHVKDSFHLNTPQLQT